jgi:hypothetical protein
MLRFVDEGGAGADIEGALLALEEVLLEGISHLRRQLAQEISFCRHQPDCFAVFHRPASCAAL